MDKRSLYECGNARVRDGRIYCIKGYAFDGRTVDGTISILRLARGYSLELTVCQYCTDFNCMGEPLAASERGWENL